MADESAQVSFVDLTLIASIVDIVDSGKRIPQIMRIEFSESPSSFDPWAIAHYLLYLGMFNEDFGRHRFIDRDDVDYFLFRFLRDQKRYSLQNNRPSIVEIKRNSPLQIVVDFIGHNWANIFLLLTFLETVRNNRANGELTRLTIREKKLGLSKARIDQIRNILESSDSFESLARNVP